MYPVRDQLRRCFGSFGSDRAYTDRRRSVNSAQASALRWRVAPSWSLLSLTITPWADATSMHAPPLPVL